MRLLYTSDLHGNTRDYTALLALAATQRAEAIIVGGDLLPPTISLRTAIARQRAFIIETLRPLFAVFRHTHPSVALYLLPGNDDWAAAIATLNDLESEDLVRLLHERVYSLPTGDDPIDGDAPFIAGYGCVPITPFSIKDYERRDTGSPPAYSFEMAYTSHPTWSEPRSISRDALLAQPSIAADLAALARHSPPAQTIYVCHAPPYDTALDYARGGNHIGSVAMRQFIERNAPLVTLHGHIHESPAATGRYADRIGRTWCINPGHNGRDLHAVFFDSDDIAGTLWHTIYGRYVA